MYRKNIAYIGFGAIHTFRHPLWVLNVFPMNKMNKRKLMYTAHLLSSVHHHWHVSFWIYILPGLCNSLWNVLPTFTLQSILHKSVRAKHPFFMSFPCLTLSKGFPLSRRWNLKSLPGALAYSPALSSLLTEFQQHTNLLDFSGNSKFFATLTILHTVFSWPAIFFLVLCLINSCSPIRSQLKYQYLRDASSFIVT